MKIAIVGMGLAGAYLASMLNKDHKVTGFERLPEDKFDSVCAWGTSMKGVEGFAKNVGLNFNDYIIHKGKEMRVDLWGRKLKINLIGLCIFEKKQFIKDMAKSVDIKYSEYITKENLPNKYDLIIDATGLTRTMLPRIKNDLLIPCVQYKVKYKDTPRDDFYVKPFPNFTGYFWYFPLRDGYAHIGAGDYKKGHNLELNNFLKKYPCEIISKTGRPVRILPPRLCRPIYSGNVVGVGESIGTVFSLLGEGIIPSLQCADILFNNLDNLQEYEVKVLSKFKSYNRVYSFLSSKLNNKYSFLSQIINLLSIYRYMKSNEDRFGLQIRLRDVLKLGIQ